MILLPIFGKDSVPHTQSRILSAGITFLFWLILLVIVCLVFPKNKEEKQKPIQIVLEPVSSEVQKLFEFTQADLHTNESAVSSLEKSAELTAPEQMDAPIKENVVAKEQIKASEPKIVQNQTVKNSNIKKETNTSTNKINYSQSVEDMFAKQTSAPKKTATWDESAFNNASTNTLKQTENQIAKIENAGSFSGAAASVSNSNSSQTSTAKPQVEAGTTSAQTSNALSNITQASSYSSSTNGTKSISSLNTSKSSNGNVLIQMEGGGARALIQPLTPAIKLSDEAEKTFVYPSMTVKITFTVNENGYVPAGSISITAGVLTEQIKKEIVEQISSWRFDSATFKSKAIFEYTIIKK